MVKQAFSGKDEEIRQQFRDLHERESKTEEEKERKNKFCDLALDMSTLYPLIMIGGEFGAVINPKDENDMGHPVHKDDEGLRMVFLNPTWLDARIGEFRMAGQSEAEAKRHAGECAVASFVTMMTRLVEDFIIASSDWGSPEKSPVEVAVVILLNLMAQARGNGIPSSILQMWTLPVMMANLDKSEIDEILGKFDAKMKERIKTLGKQE